MSRPSSRRSFKVSVLSDNFGTFVDDDGDHAYLTELNDDAGFDFGHIADIIERELAEALA